MSSYNGSATITYSITRYRNPDGTYRLVTDDDQDDNVVELDLHVTGSVSFTPGKYYGAPENCYPDEGDEEITSITCLGKSFDESDLTDDERRGIIESITEDVQNQEEPFDEPDDSYEDYDGP